MLVLLLLILGGGLALVLLAGGSGDIGGLATDSVAQMVVLGALALWIGSAVLRRPSGGVGATLSTALIWLAVLLALMVGYGYRDDLTAFGGRTIALLSPGTPMETGRRGEAAVTRSRDGHFHVNAVVDGAPIRFMVDTGASAVVLSDRDARRAGIDPDRLVFDLDISTANGRTKAAAVRLATITVGDLRVTGVRALVTRPGQLDVSLLGNTFLSRLSSFTVEGNRLTLRE